MDSVITGKARPPRAPQQSVAAEFRDSLLLLGLSLAVTVGAAAAQAALALLG